MDRNGKNFRTYGIRNVIGSVFIVYAIMTTFSTQGVYNWTTKLDVSPFSQDLKEWSELLWAAASLYHLDEPRNTLDSWFLGLQDAPPLLYPRSYARTVEIREKRALRRMEQALVEKNNPKLAAKLLKEKQTMEPEVEVVKGKRPRVLILGDSIMMTVGPVLKDTVKTQMAGTAIVRAKLASGLARPDVFDWNDEVRSFVRKSKFDLIVMMLGTNDSQDFVDNGKILYYGSTGWVSAYNRRLFNVMKSACEGSKKVVWFGLPPMKSANFERKAFRINSWAKKQAALSGCVDFVSTEKILGDENGNFTSYAKIGDHMEKIRMVDGIHVTKKGGLAVSRFLFDNYNRKSKAAVPVAH